MVVLGGLNSLAGTAFERLTRVRRRGTKTLTWLMAVEREALDQVACTLRAGEAEE
jgi:hypothetical protein